MIDPKLHPSSKGKPMHYSVGAIIKKDDTYLLLDRVSPPFGFAAPAGHIDEWENKKQALKRIVQLETGLEVVDFTLLSQEEIDWNTCSRNIHVHHWFVFECKTTGDINRSYSESKSLKWYTIKEMKKLKLEEMWKYWFKKLKII